MDMSPSLSLWRLKMKRIIRFDARPDDLEVIEKARQDKATIVHKGWMKAQKIWEKNNTPEMIAARRKAEAEKHARNRKLSAERDKESFIHNPISQFQYYEKAKISNPAPDDAGCGEHEKYKDMIVEIQDQGRCKCIHAYSSPDNFCLWGVVEGEKDRHHFESKELEKIETKKVCVQCLSARGPLMEWDGICSCDEINGEENG